MNREQLEALLKSKLGEDFDCSVITDEDLASLLPSQNPDDDGNGDDDNDDIDNTTDQNDDNNTINNTDDDDDELDLEDIDPDELSPSERMLYKALMKEKQKAKKEKMNVLITSANLTPANQTALNKMVGLGASVEDVKEMIKTFQEAENKSVRSKGLGSKIFSQKQIKVQSTVNKPKVKLGSRDFGASLVR